MKLPQLRAIERVYDDLPSLDCKGLCGRFCGPPPMTRVERDRIRRRAGKVPEGGYPCEMLVNGACSIYAYRPLVCRLWGLSEDTRCPHGCIPDRWLTRDEVVALIRQVDTIGGGTVLNLDPDLAGVVAEETEKFRAKFEGKNTKKAPLGESSAFKNC